MQILKLLSWLGFLSGAICLIASVIFEDLFFLVTAIGAIGSGAVFAALNSIIVELKEIRSEGVGAVNDGGSSFRTQLILIAAGGSLFMLLGAFAFQYIGGMAPCKLCIWQRYPHAIAIVIGAFALWLPGRALPLLGALATLTTSGIGLYHTGVERGWWEGPTTCTSGPIGNLSAEDLMAQIMSAPLVRCDDVPWEMFTLSMASWNAIVSFGLVLVWLAAAKR